MSEVDVEITLGHIGDLSETPVGHPVGEQLQMRGERGQ
jgi:hypothetical protein